MSTMTHSSSTMFHDLKKCIVEHVSTSSVERVKQLELLLLLDFILLSPKSLERNTKAHRKKTHEKRVLINAKTH